MQRKTPNTVYRAPYAVAHMIVQSCWVLCSTDHHIHTVCNHTYISVQMLLDSEFAVQIILRTIACSNMQLFVAQVVVQNAACSHMYDTTRICSAQPSSSSSYMGEYKDPGGRGALHCIFIPICIVYQYCISIPMPRSYMGEYKDHGGCGALQCIFTDAATLCRPAPPLSCRGIHLLPSCHIQLACCIIILLHRHSAGIMSKLGQLYGHHH